MAPFDVLAFRPCGPCGAYVPADAGCTHWRPRKVRRISKLTPEQRARATEAKRRQRANVRARIEEFRASMGY